jgi:hypothetical protein
MSCSEVESAQWRKLNDDETPGMLKSAGSNKAGANARFGTSRLARSWLWS